MKHDRSEIKGDARPNTTGLEQLIGYNLKRVYMLVRDDFRASLAGDDLSPRVFSALSLTVENEGITQSEVARRLSIERSGLVSIIDILEERGLVQRMPVKGDRRAQALHPTFKGNETYDRALKTVFKHEERAFDMLSSVERDQMMALLRKIRAGSSGGQD